MLINPLKYIDRRVKSGFLRLSDEQSIMCSANVFKHMQILEVKILTVCLNTAVIFPTYFSFSSNPSEQITHLHL